jgi:hypothetical protein
MLTLLGCVGAAFMSSGLAIELAVELIDENVMNLVAELVVVTAAEVANVVGGDDVGTNGIRDGKMLDGEATVGGEAMLAAAALPT